jgi:hypothetical protein
VLSKPIRYVDSSEVRATRPSGGAHLRLELIGDQTILSARVKRSFPSSKPNEFLSIQTDDNKEVAVLRSLEGLDKETRHLIEGELDRRYFTPTISRIIKLRMEAGMWRFLVETQRGEAEFFVRNWRDNAFEISPSRWLIHSVDGGRFEIMKLESLDPPSQALMDQLL